MFRFELLVIEIGLSALKDVSVEMARLSEREAMQVLKIPLTKGSGVGFADAVFDESLGTDELVVVGVVDDIESSHFLGDRLGGPAEVINVDAESASPHVTIRPRTRRF